MERWTLHYFDGRRSDIFTDEDALKMALNKTGILTEVREVTYEVVNGDGNVYISENVSMTLFHAILCLGID